MIKKGLAVIFLSFSVGLLQAQSLLPDSLELKWEQYKLKNGIRVLLQPDAGQNEVSVEFWIHTGAKDEIPGKYGFAHYFEHATPYGFLNDPTSSNAFKEKKTDSNAQTRKDYTRYYVKVKPEGLELALRYTSERLRADPNSITDSLAERHKTNVLNEMSRQESNPLWSPRVTSVREAVTFGQNHPYGHSTYGSEAENKEFTAAEVKEWYEKYFYPGNIILFVVGNFEVENAKTIIEKEFGGISGNGQRTKNKVPAVKQAATTSTLSLPTNTNFVSITWRFRNGVPRMIRLCSSYQMCCMKD
jgi:zinc protease